MFWPRCFSAVLARSCDIPILLIFRSVCLGSISTFLTPIANHYSLLALK